MMLASQLRHLHPCCLTAHPAGNPLLLLGLLPLVLAVQQNLCHELQWGESPVARKLQCLRLPTLLQHQLTLAGQRALLLWGQQHLLL
jgi:hypothetical protein